MTNNFKVLAIGDMVVEPFIKIDEGHLEDTAKGTFYCIPYGAKIPYVSKYMAYAVGNSANASVSLARLGVSVALMSSCGKDYYGDKCIESLTKEGVITKYTKQHDNIPTNYHFVLWHGVDRTILINHEKFPYKMLIDETPEYVYFSSIGSHTKDFHFEILEYIKSNPSVKLCFQPGTFQLNLRDEIKDLYKKSFALCVNKEEAELLLEMENHSEIIDLLIGLKNWGPEIIIITNGGNGAHMYYNNTHIFMPPYPDETPPLERTGAGDAFFSTFVAFMALGNDPLYSIWRAPINSMSVVHQVGAQNGLLTKDALEELFKKAPKDYTPKVIEG